MELIAGTHYRIRWTDPNRPGSDYDCPDAVYVGTSADEGGEMVTFEIRATIAESAGSRFSSSSESMTTRGNPTSPAGRRLDGTPLASSTRPTQRRSRWV